MRPVPTAGDIASDLDTKRKRSVAVIARSLAPPPELPPGVVLQGRSGSSKVWTPALRPSTHPPVTSHINFWTPPPHQVIPRVEEALCTSE